ncbi:QueT transporter family protein [Clostridium polynesiense]|uniref:QueT transporter family protein n=1 Tax=Clostridium polynesiense TaxID=1325933 RepID=UPI00058CDDD0|nr:QueT transporter family protein [Clostridium polynesiense]
MKNKNVDFIVKTAVVAALYAILTYAFGFMSYGLVQFRVSEILTLLAFISPAYIPGLVLGCILANIISTVGWIDMIVGTAATFIAVFLISRTKNLLLASIWPALINGLFIGAMLNYVANIPFMYAAIWVAFGEFAVVTLVGYPVFKYLINRGSPVLEVIKFKK